MKLRSTCDHTSNAISGAALAAISASVVQNSNKILLNVKLNGVNAKSFMDTGSSQKDLPKKV